MAEACNITLTKVLRSRADQREPNTAIALDLLARSTMTGQETDDLGLTLVIDVDGKLTTIDMLLATDAMAAGDLLNDANIGTEISAVELTLRRLANELHTTINEGSDIS